MTALWTSHGGGSGDGSGFISGIGDTGISGNGGDGFGSGTGYSDGYGFGSGGSGTGDGYSEGYGYPEQDTETSRVAIGRILVEYPTLSVVDLATLAVTL